MEPTQWSQECGHQKPVGVGRSSFICEGLHAKKAARRPHIHLYRCLKIPQDVQDLVTAQTFTHLNAGDKSEPKWIRKGNDNGSWDGWVWSNGDGWYWTEKRGYHRLISAHVKHC